MHSQYPEVGERIRQSGKLDAETEKLLIEGITKLKEAKYHG